MKRVTDEMQRELAARAGLVASLDAEAVRGMGAVAVGLVESLRAQGLSVSRLDLGGGLGVPYFNMPEPPSPDDFADVVAEAVSGLDVELAFEPGRVIAANAGGHVPAAYRPEDAASRATNHLVAHVVPVRLVDGPRARHVHDHQSDRHAVAPRCVAHIVKALIERPPVEEPR